MIVSGMIDNFFKINTLVILLSTFILITNISIGETLIEIDNPRFTEKNLDDKIYEIKAEKGYKSNDNLQLNKVEGKFKGSDGIWIYLEADQGNYSQKLNTITLENNVLFYTEKNETFKSKFAKFDMTNDIIELEKKVEHFSNMGSVTSDYSIINDLNTITYIGKVKTKLNSK